MGKHRNWPPNGLDSKSNANCVCERMVSSCPRHDSSAYAIYNAEHRGSKHRADRPVDSNPTMAECRRAGHPAGRAWGTCPRHHPENYTDSQALHANDSI